MPAPAVSHLICTSALVMLIFVMPIFYATIADNIRSDMTRRELKEIADYVSSTLENLYFLVNSTDSIDVFLEKEMLYLPSAVENSIYVLEIDGSGGNASRIIVYLRDRSSVEADAWLVPGLKRDTSNYSIESGGRTVVAGCRRNGTYAYACIKYR